jgi:hypothetical protein
LVLGASEASTNSFTVLFSKIKLVEPGSNSTPKNVRAFEGPTVFLGAMGIPISEQICKNVFKYCRQRCSLGATNKKSSKICNPKGGSVNDFISPEYSSVQYTRIEDAISAIKMCQSDAYLAKCDIEMAYRNLPLSPFFRT